MATIPRAPVLSTQQRRPTQQPNWTGPNLLTSTLLVAAAALPFNNAQAFPAQVQHPSHVLSANADTSRGTPKTLFADAATPTFDAPAFAADHPLRNRRGNLDTSAGVPKTLTADSVRPIFDAPGHTVDRPQAHGQNADTSRGIPKPLTADAVAPFFVAPGFVPVSPRTVFDTSRGVPETLLPTGAVAAPFVSALSIQVDSRRQIDVGSFVPTWFAPVASAPFVNPPQWSPPKVWWQPDDTSASTPKAFIADAVAPTFNAPSLLVDRLRFVEDTSQSTPKPLYADAVAPFSNAPTLQTDRVRPVADTSTGLNLSLATIVQPAPFAQTDWPAPIAFKQTFESDYYAPLVPDLIPPAIVPPPVVVVAPVVNTDSIGASYSFKPHVSRYASDQLDDGEEDDLTDDDLFNIAIVLILNGTLEGV